MIREARSLRSYGWLIAILLAVVVFSPDPGNSCAIRAAHDFAHAPVFGLVCVLMLLWLRVSQRWRALGVARHYALAIAVACALGLATEIAQAFAARDASWTDLRSDVLGAFAFAGMFAATDRRIATRRAALAVCILGLAALTWHTVPLALTAADYARRRQEFPVLMNGDSAARNGFLTAIGAEMEQGRLPAAFARAAHEQALRVRFVAGEWPGVDIDEPEPNWSAYRTLALDLTNPGDEPLRVVLRVHDRAHDYRFSDRFNRSFELQPRQRKTLAIALEEIERAPRGRTLDLRRIANLMLFTTKEYVGKELYVSRIWLENDH